MLRTRSPEITTVLGVLYIRSMGTGPLSGPFPKKYSGEQSGLLGLWMRSPRIEMMGGRWAQGGLCSVLGGGTTAGWTSGGGQTLDLGTLKCSPAQPCVSPQSGPPPRPGSKSRLLTLWLGNKDPKDAQAGFGGARSQSQPPDGLSPPHQLTQGLVRGKRTLLPVLGPSADIANQLQHTLPSGSPVAPCSREPLLTRGRVGVQLLDDSKYFCFSKYKAHLRWVKFGRVLTALRLLQRP